VKASYPVSKVNSDTPQGKKLLASQLAGGKGNNKPNAAPNSKSGSGPYNTPSGK
jgi:hypothetical protein